MWCFITTYTTLFFRSQVVNCLVFVVFRVHRWTAVVVACTLCFVVIAVVGSVYSGSRRAETDEQRRNMGVQPQLHAVHSAVDLRVADVDRHAGHLRVRLLERRPNRAVVSRVCRAA